MATKFIRTLTYNTGIGAGSLARVAYMMKVMYEFWGFCVNGTASLTAPGGFAATTPTNMPANFTGGTSLLASGSDGVTSATTIFRADGYTVLTAASAPFNNNMVGKLITIWKANSNSTEDSVYSIIGVNSSSQIVININSAGIPSPTDGYRPTCTARSAINYRVTDLQIAAAATTDGNYFVMQLDPTGINVGQNNSQVRFTIAANNLQMNAQISPAGTWNGSAFTDGTATITPSPNQFGSQASLGVMTLTLTGDKDFLIGTFRDRDNGNPWMFHLEIPERLYTQTQDLNPVALLLSGSENSFGLRVTSVLTTQGYGGGFFMRCNDGVVRQHRVSVRALLGDGNANLGYSLAQTPGNSLSDFRVCISQNTGQILSSSGFLTLPGVAGQYALARCRLRKVVFANIALPIFSRFGANNNDYILLTQGVALPWDKTVLPNTLFPF